MNLTKLNILGLSLAHLIVASTFLAFVAEGSTKNLVAVAEYSAEEKNPSPKPSQSKVDSSPRSLPSIEVDRDKIDYELLEKRILAMELITSGQGKGQGQKQEQGQQKRGGKKSEVLNLHNMDVPSPVSEASIRKLLRLQREDGSFENVPYDDLSRSDWKTSSHLDHCRSLAIALHVLPDTFLREHKIEEKCLLALDYWLEKKFKNPNWWYNDISVPHSLALIALLLPERLRTPERLATIKELTKTARPARTGQNLLWLSWNSFLVGLVMRDDIRLLEALRAFDGGVCMAKPGEEGIQPDYSFHQHGAHFYQGNYGRAYLHSASKYVRLVSGTPWDSPDKREIVERFLLEGTRPMCINDLLDYNAIGRQISYLNRPQGPDLAYVALNLMSPESTRNAELKEFFDEIVAAKTIKDSPSSGANPTNHNTDKTTGKTTKSLPKELTRVGAYPYPCSDYLAYRAKHFFVGIKLSSKRMILGEECNGDNLKGAYLSDGCMLTYSSNDTAKENTYSSGAFPVWDWTRVPGTTARSGDLPHFTTWSGKRGSNDFAVVKTVKDKSGQDVGIAAMNLDHFGLAGYKSYFVFPDRIVCLGSDITDTRGENTSINTNTPTNTPASLDSASPANPPSDQPSALVQTSVEQSSAQTGTLVTDTHKLNDGAILHSVTFNGNGERLYLLAPGTDYVACYEEQHGAPASIRSTASKESITEKVFSLTINHGKASQKAGYYYQVFPCMADVLPSTKANEIKTAIPKLWADIKVLQCDDTAHVIERDGITYAIFFPPDSLDPPF